LSLVPSPQDPRLLRTEVFRKDLETGEIVGAGMAGGLPAISANGRFTVVTSDYAPNNPPERIQLLRRDLETGEAVLVN